MSNGNPVETICQGLTTIHELWAVPVELGIALWLLERQLGLAFLAPTAVAMFAVCLLPRSNDKAGLEFSLHAELTLWLFRQVVLRLCQNIWVVPRRFG
jgi:hypothetical protein